MKMISSSRIVKMSRSLERLTITLVHQKPVK